MQFNELNDNQRRLMVNSIQTFDAWRDAMARYARYRGGMTWKTVKGKQYLYRILDRFGHARSLGARSPETEAIYDEFVSAKTGLASRLKSLEGKLAEQARFNRAGRIGRLPNIIGAITTQLDRHNLLGDNLIIIGTNALYAYEAMAGAFLTRNLSPRPMWACSGTPGHESGWSTWRAQRIFLASSHCSGAPTNLSRLSRTHRSARQTGMASWSI